MTGLDPQIARMLARMPAAASTGVDVAEARRASRERAQTRSGDVDPVDRVSDRTVRTTAGDVAVRIYAPAGSALPVLVFLHGGGWVVGGLDGPDALCRTLADRAHCMVVSIDYPLAPEHKFPAALEASYGVVRWVRDAAGQLGADPGRMAVGGESAGGNLAAAIAQLSRDRGGPALSLQLLITPALDHAFDTASYLENAEGYGLTRREMMWWWTQYLARDVDGSDPYASPLRATDLRRLPPALIVTAQFDPLRDEGRAYARRLGAAGVAVDHRDYLGAVHGFLAMAGEVDCARDAVEYVASGIRKHLAQRPGSAPTDDVAGASQSSVTAAVQD